MAKKRGRSIMPLRGEAKELKNGFRQKIIINTHQIILNTHQKIVAFTSFFRQNFSFF